VKRALYAGLGMVAWKIGKRYVRRRVRGVKTAIAR
jgi:hypothetical protein